MAHPPVPWPNKGLQDRFVLSLRVEFLEVGTRMPEYVLEAIRATGKVFPQLVVEWDYLSSRSKFSTTLADLASKHKRMVVESLRESFNIGRWAGRGDLARTPLQIDWYPINERRSTAYFEIRIEMVDVPMDLFPRVRELVDTFFDGTATAGVLRSATGSVKVVTARWPHQANESTCHPPMVLVEDLTGRTGVVQPTIPSIQWITWLGPAHLERLGGKSAFLARAGAFRKEHDVKDLIVRSHGKNAVLVECAIDIFDPEFAEFDVFEEMQFEVDSFAATWFTQEIARAGLFAWQHWKPTWNKADNEADNEVDAPDNEDDGMDIDDDSDDAPSRKAHVAQAASRHDDLWKLLTTTPPECFSDAPANPTAADRRWARQTYGEMATCFVVADDQGRTSLPVWVRLQDDQPFATDPIFVGHPSLKDSCFAFQSHRHGYNGKQGHNHWPRRKAPDLFHCPRCGKDKFRVLTVFQYSGDEDDESDPRIKRSPQDFFSWLAIRATCSACKWVGTIADIECA